ncbi:LysR family transcriptional regulator [Mixta tenebrionis]|uniref:LysR family transcriptional regulator n=1 Tax=Mixta tenebrionis TaxID=2562439 RepID=A0A506V2B6_9GAMM|nr:MULTISPECIES: LysR family transcriptional regulator [Mixta]QHM74189.1 Virulence genes transcriptional activator [Mixta theicola]TPW39795.1 LysR family transcriptional regulator [Mixta tenebrionis]
MFITRAMRVFIILYEEKNLKSAADKLCLTVPPITRMLKLTEEWLGEQLFILERNRLIPTEAADNVYQQLYPHYSALTQFHHPSAERDFRISSPQAGHSFMADLLAKCQPSLPEKTTIRYAGNMHTDDDIFISLQPAVLLPNFEIFRADQMLELHYISSGEEGWKDKPVLFEHNLDQLPSFRHVLDEMYQCGHNGQTRRIDNAVWLKEAYEHGEGLLFRRPEKATDGSRVLPFILHLSLSVYINTLKRDLRHETFLTCIKKSLNYFQ